MVSQQSLSISAPRSRQLDLMSSVAVLLVTAARIDGPAPARNRRYLLRELCGSFALSRRQLFRVLRRALSCLRILGTDRALRVSCDTVRETLTKSQRSRVTDAIWNVALSDGKLSHNEVALYTEVIRQVRPE